MLKSVLNLKANLLPKYEQTRVQRWHFSKDTAAKKTVILNVREWVENGFEKKLIMTKNYKTLND